MAINLKTIKNIGIQGRRFRDSNGNTYYSSELSINGEVVEKINNNYGYDNAYMNDIIEKFIMANSIDVEEERRLFYNNPKIKISSNVIDCKKRDMLEFGI